MSNDTFTYTFLIISALWFAGIIFSLVYKMSKDEKRRKHS